MDKKTGQSIRKIKSISSLCFVNALRHRLSLRQLVLIGLCFSWLAHWHSGATAATDATPQLETVANFYDAMPRGVAVSRTGRIFVCFPRFGGHAPYTVAELENGKPIPFPSTQMNQIDMNPAKEDRLVSVISAVIDQREHLWILDTGRHRQQDTADGAKLVGVDLKDNKVFKIIHFSKNLMPSDTVLTDLRVCQIKDSPPYALISATSQSGPNAIIVVNLQSGESVRRLNGHYSVTAEQDYVVFAEGEMLRRRKSETEKTDYTAGVSGLAISPDASTLYFCPLAGRQLFSVSVRALIDKSMSDAQVAKTIKKLCTKMSSSDGLECDGKNRIYFTDVENNAIWRTTLNCDSEKIVRDRRLSWPDSLCLAADGYLYITASQFHKHPLYHYGKDLRQKPYQLFRIKVGG